MVYCCVPFCGSEYRKERPVSVSFHQFPVDADLREQWLRRIPRENFTVNSNSASSVVCSKHFKPEDFCPGLMLKKLRKGAVPSVFPEFYPVYDVLKLNKKRVLALKFEKEERIKMLKKERAEILKERENKTMNKKEGSKTEQLHDFPKPEKETEGSRVNPFASTQYERDLFLHFLRCAQTLDLNSYSNP